MFGVFSALLFAMAWLIPNHYLPWTSFYNECCSALALLVLAVSTWRYGRYQSMPWVAVTVCCVAAIAPLQWAAGLLMFSSDALVSAIYVLGFASAIVVGHSISTRDPRRLPILMSSAALAAGLVSAGLALFQSLQVSGLGIWLQDVRPGDRAFANLGQPNHLGTLLGLAMLGLLFLSEVGLCRKRFALPALTWLLIGSSLTQSRTSLAYGLLTAAGLIVAYRRGCAFKTRPAAVLAIWVVQLSLMAVWPKIQALLLLSQDVGLAQRGLGSVRYTVWPMLLDALLRSPFFGYGWLQTGAAELAVVNFYPSVGEMWMQAHNLFLDLLLWSGIPLGGLLIVLICGWIVTRCRRVSTREGFVGVLVVLVVFVHSMVEFPYQYAYFLLPVGVWIGQVETDVDGAEVAVGCWSVLPQLAAAALAICLCLDYPSVEEDFRLVRFERLKIGRVRESEAAPSAPFLSSLTAYLSFMRMSPQSDMSESQLASVGAIVQRYPYAVAMFRYGEMQALNGRLSEALSTFSRVRKMFATDVYARLRLDLHERARSVQALQEIDRALPLAAIEAPTAR